MSEYGKDYGIHSITIDGLAIAVKRHGTAIGGVVVGLGSSS